ncbi:MAG: hypothetical protein ACKVOM_03645 [Ferruginibacter sp.]
MKHIKYFAIILLCLTVFQDVAAQVRVNVGVRNRANYYRHRIIITTTDLVRLSLLGLQSVTLRHTDQMHIITGRLL